MKRLAFLICVIATGASADVMPGTFQGEWNTTLSQCGTDLNDSRLFIGAKTIRFYESGGVIRAAVPGGPFQITIIAELTGEGKSWITPVQYNLSSDGKRLIDTTRGDAGMVRYRCPKVKVQR